MLEMASSVAKTSMSVAQGMCSLPRLLGKIYKTPVWQNSLFTHSVASFMKFDLGKASVKKKIKHLDSIFNKLLTTCKRSTISKFLSLQPVLISY